MKKFKIILFALFLLPATVASARDYGREEARANGDRSDRSALHNERYAHQTLHRAHARPHHHRRHKRRHHVRHY